jgi:transcriptional regulator with XRE-family HTH domain
VLPYSWAAPVAKSLYRTENLELAALLRQLREDAGLVQIDLAERLGRNQTFVSNVELGIRRLDLVELRDYCQSLDISLVKLIERWEVRILPAAKSRRAASGKRKANG